MRKNKKKNYIGLGLLFLIGLSILLYPMVSDAWNRYRDSLLISNYSSSVSSDDNSEKIDSMWKAAQEYNEQIKQESVPDAFSVRDGQTDSTYESLLNLNGDGMMGYVEIPVIDVSIPIYHYTTDETLEKGAGHLFGSSLPVGGKSTHCILSAHRGLPSAKLFTVLNLVVEGLVFYLHVLGKTLAYEVDQILPMVDKDDHETLENALKIEEGKDQVTLFTCTPYGVNTERLLVRGHRVEYVEQEVEAEKTLFSGISIHTNYLLWVIVGLLVTVAFIVVLYKKEQKLKKRRAEQATDEQEAPAVQDRAVTGDADTETEKKE